jgi:hypothetical protein
MLLRLLTVAGEGLGKVVGGRGRVRVGGVVDLCGQSVWRAIGVQQMVYELVGVLRLPRKRIMGWRPCWRSVLVAFIATGGNDFGAGRRALMAGGRYQREGVRGERGREMAMGSVGGGEPWVR